MNRMYDPNDQTHKKKQISSQNRNRYKRFAKDDFKIKFLRKQNNYFDSPKQAINRQCKDKGYRSYEGVNKAYGINNVDDFFKK